MTRRGLSMRSPLKVLTTDRSIPVKVIEKIDKTTTMKSRMFQPFLRYE